MKFKLFNFDRLTIWDVNFIMEHGHRSLPKHTVRSGLEFCDCRGPNRVEVLKMVSESFEKDWFNHVANVTADTIDDVERLINDPSVTEEEYKRCVERLPVRKKRHELMHSLSVGDVVENENGERFLCDRWGWNKI